MTWRGFVTRHRLVMPFVDLAVNGDTTTVSDVAAVGDVAPLGNGALS